jgi:SAM-dependent methyltransferase
MTDKETLAAYAAKADDYANKFARAEPTDDLTAFLNAVPKGAKLLDLGCGPGNSAALMRDAGMDVDAMDASPEMIAIARDTHNIEAKLASFDALTATALYDGIWANFSLLHAPRADMPRHLSAIEQALKPGGIFHIGLKTGEGEQRDALGRFYTFYTEEGLRELLDAAGLTMTHIRHGAEAGLAGTVDPYMIVRAHA